MSKTNIDYHWIVDETGRHLRLFEVIHPLGSNGTDGTPQVRLTRFFDGWVREYADDDQRFMTIEGAREWWIASTRKKSHGVNWRPVRFSKVDWDEKHGTARIVE